MTVTGRPRTFRGTTPHAEVQLEYLLLDLRMLYDRHKREWVTWEKQALIDAIDKLERLRTK
jgi:hypothetical protein